ncbi:MAG: MFS transporter [Burkholderiaceae bacterium]|jgi:MFS family permease|nr:MFS transporter [Burkholderiaceae bacterium]
METTTSDSSQQAIEEALYRKVAWRLIPLLLACYVVAYLDRVNVGFAKLQMMDQLGFSDTIYGLGAGMFFIGYFLFEVPSNIILHKMGARVWIGRIMISWGLISAAMMFVTTPTMFYVMRFLLGVAEAGFFPGIILYLTYWYPADRRARITAMFMTGIAIAGVIGGPVSGIIMKYTNGIYGWQGWQWMFLLEGLPSVALGLVVIMMLDDRISEARWLTEEERALLAHNIAKDEAHKEDESFLRIISSGKVWLCAAIYFSYVMGVYGVSFFLPTIIKSMGHTDVVEIGLISSIPYSVSVVVMLLVARSADRTGERRWHVAIPGMLGAVGLALSVILAKDGTLAIAALTLGLSGIMTTLPLFWSLPTAFLAGTGAAAGIALINSLGNLAGFVSPYAVGWLKDATGSTDAGVYLLAAAMVVGVLLTLAVPKQLVNR